MWFLAALIIPCLLLLLFARVTYNRYIALLLPCLSPRMPKGIRTSCTKSSPTSPRRLPVFCWRGECWTT